MLGHLLGEVEQFLVEGVVEGGDDGAGQPLLDRLADLDQFS
ncbi:hypothetical protein [Streptosporangium sp. NPDC003464]